jgi:hypothetical protein
MNRGQDIAMKIALTPGVLLARALLDRERAPLTPS